jgi:hypothetical protein
MVHYIRSKAPHSTLLFAETRDSRHSKGVNQCTLVLNQAWLRETCVCDEAGRIDGANSKRTELFVSCGKPLL